MFVIEVPYFNLDQIYNSGQVPRWIKLKDSKYIIPFRDKALKIEQQRDRYDWNKHRLIMSCSEDEFFNIWFNYLDLATNCFPANVKIKKLGNKFRIIANRGAGIHIMRQDTFETYVLCKIISNAGYAKAYMAMNHIAEVCGIKHVQSMREAGKITWYEWPTPEMILENYDKLKEMGNINIWLKSLCEVIIKRGLNILLESENELFRLLGLHEVDKFPLNGIENILAKNFDCDPEDFADWYLNEIENKGLVYMYIVHHVLNSPNKLKEVASNGVN